MKKECGYIDQRGNFHKTLVEYNNAEIEYKVKDLQRKIHNLETSLERYIESYYLNLSYDEDVVIKNISVIIDIITSDRIYERIGRIRNERDEIQEEIDRLNSIKGRNKYFRKDFWSGKLSKITYGKMSEILYTD